MTTQVIWIDANIDHEENRNYIKELNLMGSIRLGLFKDVNKAITHLKMIEFKATKIIVNSKLVISRILLVQASRCPYL